MSEPLASYDVHEAKTHLSRILERVEQGEEIVINRAGTPVAKVVPAAITPTARPPVEPAVRVVTPT